MQTLVTVVVSELEHGKAASFFAAQAEDGWNCVPAPASEPEFAAVVRANQARYAVVGVEPYRGELYDALGKGGVLARFGVGHDGVDKERATAAGVLCTNTPGVLDDSVAEHAVALMLALARHIPEMDRDVHAGTWQPRVGAQLRGRQLAVIGCGGIGRRVAEITALGLGMNVIGCEVVDVDAEEMRRRHGFARIVREFGVAVAGAAYVSLHIPATRATAEFLNAARLSCLERDACVVNTARGSVVDEVALYDALASGALAGAALDVLQSEPYQPADPHRDLRTLPNVILTSHAASSTTEACTRMAARALENIACARGQRFADMDLLNPEVVAS